MRLNRQTEAATLGAMEIGKDMRRRMTSAAFTLGAVSIAIFLGLIDYISGYDLNFFVFYFIPVALTAWKVGPRSAAIVAVMCAACWFFVDILSEHRYSHPIYAYWNAGIRLLSFLVVAAAVWTLRAALERERGLRQEIQNTLEEIRTLRGMLPICASCKKIRNDQGYWEQIEHYIAERSEAEFTHSICPDCVKTLYPELARKMAEAKDPSTPESK